MPRVILFVLTLLIYYFESLSRWSGINWLPESFLNPVGAYSSPNKSLASRFSFHHSIEDAKSDPGGLPNTYAWVWTEDWTIQHVQYLTPDQPTRSHDNGWFYAVNWPHTFYPEKQSRLHFVRKREWERDRRQKTAIEFIDDLMDSGFSKEAVYGALSKPDNMTSSGKMNFEKVLIFDVQVAKSVLLFFNALLACHIYLDIQDTCGSRFRSASL